MALALHDAAERGDLTRLRALLATGVDVETRGSFPGTALHRAAHNGHTACLKALLAAGASVHLENRYDSTPLELVVCSGGSGDAACVRALIAAGANVNRADELGATPFYYALLAGRPRVLKILLRAGGDMQIAERGVRIPREKENTSTWALVDAVRAAGGWPQYVSLNPPTTFARIVFKATHGDLPEPLPLEIATFLVPAGGF